MLSHSELQLIDKLAKNDRSIELRIPSDSKVSPQPGAVGPLNALRAYWMLQCLGLAKASQQKARAVIRRNWPEDWRINERGHRFDEAEFETLAVMALIENELRAEVAEFRREVTESHQHA